MKTYGERLLFAMRFRNVKQAELARAAGISQQSIAHLCKLDGMDRASRFTTQIANALDIESTWLADGTGSFAFDEKNSDEKVSNKNIIEDTQQASYGSTATADDTEKEFLLMFRKLDRRGKYKIMAAMLEEDERLKNSD